MTKPTKPAKRSWVPLLLGIGAIQFVFYVLVFQDDNVQRIPSAVARRVQPAEVSKILDAISWPIAIVVIVILLRASLGGLIGRIKELTWKDLKAIMHSREDSPTTPTREATEPEGVTPPAVAVTTAPSGDKKSGIDPAKIANIYWVGSDLVNVVNLCFGGAPRDKIAWQLRQANHHLKEVGLTGSDLQIRLQRLKDDAARSIQTDWTPEHRKEVAQEAFSIMTAFGWLTESLQPGFESRPKD